MVSSVESNVELLKYSLFLVAKLVVKLNNQTIKQINKQLSSVKIVTGPL